jgi:spore coat protein U-like protein
LELDNFMTNFRILAGVLAAAAALGGASVAQATILPTNMDVTATLTSACEVSSSGTIAFGNVVALASSGDKLASNTTGFKVACSAGLTPYIFSATTRVMDSGANTLAFDLCLAECTGTNGLAVGATTDALSITQDGSLHPVELHARITAANFKAKPAGAYAKTVVISVEY